MSLGCSGECTGNESQICINILYPDAVPPIHGESYHVATDKVPSIDDGKFRSILSIFSDNLLPFATRGKKARGTLLVDKHCHNGCSIKPAPLCHYEISGGHIWRTVVRRRGSAGPVLPLWKELSGMDVQSSSV